MQQGLLLEVLMVDLRACVLELFSLMEVNFLWSQVLLLIKASLALFPGPPWGLCRRDAATTIGCVFIVSTFIAFSRSATQKFAILHCFVVLVTLHLKREDLCVMYTEHS
jgi:hypothetical protein